jgi:hypothetical protein
MKTLRLILEVYFIFDTILTTKFIPTYIFSDTLLCLFIVLIIVIKNIIDEYFLWDFHIQ